MKKQVHKCEPVFFIICAYLFLITRYAMPLRINAAMAGIESIMP